MSQKAMQSAFSLVYAQTTRDVPNGRSHAEFCSQTGIDGRLSHTGTQKTVPNAARHHFQMVECYDTQATKPSDVFQAFGSDLVIRAMRAPVYCSHQAIP